MKTIKWLGLATFLALPLCSGNAQAPAPENPGTPAQVPPQAPVPSNLSAGVAEVMRLAEAGTSEDVVLAYIQNAGASFSLTADQILYLRDNGVSSAVITAMLNRDNVLRNQPQTYNYDQRLYAPNGQVPATAPPAAPPQEQVAPVAVPAVQAPPPGPPVEAAPPVYVSSPPPEATYFYDDLSPYGTWVELEGVGWCWQPRVVVINHAWRPYCDSGHWVWTDAGWFWQSDYSWGWAPFHYGRWNLHPRCGWVWMPDRVWGPAWVVWRSQGEHCGWAPLPPHSEFVAGVGWRFNGIRVGINFDFGLHPDHFTFIAMRDFHEHDYSHHRLPPTQVTQIYNHTTIINNYVVNNNTIVNKGIQVDRVAAATHTPVRQVHIREVQSGAPRPAASGAAEKNELVVYRPQLKAPAKPVAMVAQKVDERHPVIQHTPLALAPGRNEHTSGPGNSASAPANGNRRQQIEPPRTARPVAEHSVNNPQEQARPSNYPSAPPTTRGSEQAKPAPHAAAPYQSTPAGPAHVETKPAEPRPQTAPVPTAPHQAQGNGLYPVHNGPQAQSNPGQAHAQNPAEYHPKSYQQAAEAHALPPVNQAPKDYSGQSGNAHGQSGNPHGQSKKNEQ